MEVLAVITARGGSKGLPRKNILPLHGSPLISYSIAAALESNLVSRVICSTDCQEIADIAEKYGAEVPFLRPPELADNHSSDIDVFKHVVGWCEDLGYAPDIFVHLRPTSPIRIQGDLDHAIQQLIDCEEADSIRSVCQPSQNPFKMWRVADGRMTPLLDVENIKEPYNSPRQILPKVWWQAGSIDIVRVSVIKKKESMTGDYILPYYVDDRLHVDIDRAIDFERAEILMKDANCPVPKIKKS